MLQLAERLRTALGGTVPSGVRERSFDTSTVFDVFDLAAQLVAAPSVTAALEACTREQLEVISVLCESGPMETAAVASATSTSEVSTLAVLTELADLLLIDGEGDEPATTWHAYPHVCQTIATLQDDRTETRAPLTASLPTIDTSLVDRAATERALICVSAAVELLEELGEVPARVLSRGGIALPDSKRLAQAAGVELDEVAALLDLLEDAGLIITVTSRIFRHPDADAWVDGDVAERWAFLVHAAISKTSPELHRALHEDLTSTREGSWSQQLTSSAEWLFPLLNAQRFRSSFNRFVTSAELLGLSAGGVASRWSTVATRQPDQLADEMRQALPTPISEVYVQPDLSIVCPGPPTVELERTLRRFAQPDSVGLAATFRLTERSVNHALANGVTAEEILELLTSVSKGELPQPVRYFIAEHGERFGRVRVRAGGSEGSSEITARSETELEAILRDSSLAALGIQAADRPDGARELIAQVPPTAAVWALGTAGYPVALQDDHGQVLPVRRVYVPLPSEPLDEVQAMWDRLGQTSSTNTDDAWMAKRIEAAVKAKQKLEVTVAPEGRDPMTFIMVPTGFTNGRMRGRDVKSEVERTLPLTSIINIVPVT